MSAALWPWARSYLVRRPVSSDSNAEPGSFRLACAWFFRSHGAELTWCLWRSGIECAFSWPYTHAVKSKHTACEATKHERKTLASLSLRCTEHGCTLGGEAATDTQHAGHTHTHTPKSSRKHGIWWIHKTALAFKPADLRGLQEGGQANTPPHTHTQLHSLDVALGRHTLPPFVGW